MTSKQRTYFSVWDWEKISIPPDSGKVGKGAFVVIEYMMP